MTGPLVDLTGRTFGFLTVVGRAPNNKRGRSMWQCLCECGTSHASEPSALVHGRTVSCGCWRKKNRVTFTSTHGLTDTLEHYIWRGMKQRCQNPNHKSFSYYGGRGITVCERWNASFEAFMADMGPKPSPHHSIDRIDNDAGYSPDNCRWSTPKEQRRNQQKRINKRRRVKFQGVEMHLMDALQLVKSNIHPRTAYARIEKGWNVGLALTKPARPMRRSTEKDGFLR